MVFSICSLLLRTHGWKIQPSIAAFILKTLESSHASSLSSQASHTSVSHPKPADVFNQPRVLFNSSQGNLEKIPSLASS
jgi:hypothetical protein